jgi:hypothetical protein
VIDEPGIARWVLDAPIADLTSAVRRAAARLRRSPVRALNVAVKARVEGRQPLMVIGCGRATMRMFAEAMSEARAAHRLTLEECVYWGVIHDGAAWYYGHEIWRDMVERDVPMLRDRVHKSLDDAFRRDTSETQGAFERTQREALFCFWLCRQAIAAIGRER